MPLTLEGEYNRLFVGVGKPAVCMWESIYATGINALFQPNTLEVRNVYLRNGFKPLGMGKVADDHMAIELAFMRELALETTRAGEAQRGVAADGAATVSGGAPTSLGRCLRRTGRGARQKRILSRLCPFACRFRGARMPLSCREPLLKRFCQAQIVQDQLVLCEGGGHNEIGTSGQLFAAYPFSVLQYA